MSLIHKTVEKSSSSIIKHFQHVASKPEKFIWRDVNETDDG